VGAVSPPGGDFSEPVSQNTLRVVGAFWALDSSLADRRHFPAINWLRSYSLYLEPTHEWYNENATEEFRNLRTQALATLQIEAELQEIVQLIGPDALPERERAILEIARMIREDYLQQHAYHEIDSYCSLEKQLLMIKLISLFHQKSLEAIELGVGIDRIIALPVKDEIARMKYVAGDQFKQKHEELEKTIQEQFNSLR